MSRPGKTLGALLERWTTAARCDLENALRRCETDSERLLAVALLVQGDDGGSFLRMLPFEGDPWAQGRGGTLRVQSQIPIHALGTFVRVDMTLLRNTPKYAIAIEVDGGYHGEAGQAQKDRERDRRLTTQGWCVLRFTNDEVAHDPDHCARRVFQAAGVIAAPRLALVWTPPPAPEEIEAAEKAGDHATVDAALRGAVVKARKKRGL